MSEIFFEWVSAPTRVHVSIPSARWLVVTIALVIFRSILTRKYKLRSQTDLLHAESHTEGQLIQRERERERENKKISFFLSQNF